MPHHPAPAWLALTAACLMMVACSSRPPRAVLVVTSAAKAAPNTAAVNAASAKPSASPTPAPVAVADDGHDHEHDEASASTTPVADDGHDHEHEEPATAVTYMADVVPMLREHCASCHVPGGGVPEHAHWFDAAGEPQYQTIKDHAGIMVRMIKAGEMPKGRPNSVPPELVEELDAWRKAGAPQN